jgi:hypothetical protein
MAAWYSVRGEVISYAYRDQTFPFLASPRWIQVLFSSNHGLLAWSPIVAVCLLGLAMLYKRDRPLAVLGVGAFVAELYLIASWWSWWMGHSFGHRGFLSLTPLFVVGLATVVDRLRGSRIWPWFLGACSLLLAWNMILMAAYLSETIPKQGTFPWEELLARIPALPHRIVERLQSARTNGL